MNPRVIQKLKEWRESPLLFVNDCIQARPSDQQADALARFGKTKRMTIRSGHGCGKDTFAVWIILWFMCTRPYAKVVATAPTARQLYDILWSEISKWLRQSLVADEFIVQRDKMFHKSSPKEWWARAVSPSVKAGKEEQAETLAGFHGDHLLIIVDEASGVPDPVYVPLEGALTQEDNRVLLIGNMTKNQGYFYDTHFHSQIRTMWDKVHWDSRNSTNVTKETIDAFIFKYGVDSNVFRIRVAGEPPLDSENTLIPFAWAQQCIGTEVIPAEDEPLFLGVDVARYGEDKSIILPRKGLKIYSWEEFQGMNTITLGGFVQQTYAEMLAEGLAIDEIGVGAGVTDWLIKHGHTKTFGVNVANKSSDHTKWHRVRDELWCRMRDKCMRGVYSFPEGPMGEELCNELSSVRYEFDANGAYQVESKKDMKLRGAGSPNIADALGLTEYFESFAYKLWKTPEKKKKDKRMKQFARAQGKNRWTCV